MSPFLQISKLDAARRQMETAIQLYFEDGDPVSIHTLVAASYNVVRDVNAKHGGEKLQMKEGLLERVTDEYEKEVRKALNEAENFFKHADRDHDGAIDFDPQLSEMYLVEAC